jgi:hypothetical protein
MMSAGTEHLGSSNFQVFISILRYVRFDVLIVDSMPTMSTQKNWHRARWLLFVLADYSLSRAIAGIQPDRRGKQQY